jgi:hypothetical protein
MRLFITSYQKSGTHQIMPMFLPNIPDVVDRSWNCWINAPERYGLNRKINQKGLAEVITNLRTFKHGATKAFGHLSYTPEYAEVFMETHTKVLFNIRDPRDVIVSEYENAKRHYAEGRKEMALYNFLDKEDGICLFDKDDPITELIILAGARWPNWLGWLKHDFVLPVKYEDLRLNIQEASEKIFRWLEGTNCNSIAEMVKKAQPDSSNPTFRKGLVGEWKTTFEPHHVKLSEKLLGGIIEALGYEK